MGNIKIIKGIFDTKLELEHAEVAAGYPIFTDESVSSISSPAGFIDSVSKYFIFIPIEV